MRITKVELKNFKRFTDLTIDGIPADTRLVLLIGSNGSGKSSVFDAFEYVNTESRTVAGYTDSDSGSHIRLSNIGLSIRLSSLRKTAEKQSTITLTINDGDVYQVSSGSSSPNAQLSKSAFYGRTSYRQIPRLNRSLQERAELSVDITSKEDADRPKSFTDRDDRFLTDIDRISRQIFEDIFRKGASAVDIRKKIH